MTAMTAVFRKALHDSRRTTLWLAFGLGLYALMIMAFFPSITEQAEELDDLIDSYPREMIALFYSGNVDDFSVADPGQYVQTQFMVWAVLIIGAIAMNQVFNALTNAERDGTMDVMLSLPVSRRAMLVGRLLNIALGVLIVLAVSFVTLAASTLIWEEFDVPLGNLALGIFGAFLPIMVIVGFATMLATLVPSSRRFAGTVAYVMVFGSYLLYGFSGATTQLENIQPLLLFHYFNAGDVISNGADPANWLVLAGVATLYLSIAYWAVDRKEMGV